MEAVERHVVAPIEARLLSVIAARVREVAPPPQLTAGPSAAVEGRSASAAALLEALLRGAVEQTPASGREELFTRIVRQLGPDEARILAAICDGSVYPLVHVLAPGMPGTRSRQVLMNQSTVGRAAGVVLRERVPDYVTHLRALGLAESGPQDDLRRDEYDVLLTDHSIVEARRRADGMGPRPARVVKETLRASALGRELWQACQPPPRAGC